MNKIHKANRRGWDAASPRWQSNIDATKNWRRYPLDPGLALNAQELKALDGVSGKETCVLGSGDNLVVFALSGLGARVTSIDISRTQLDIAARRAEELELDVTFVCADVTDLAVLKDKSFDLVYTGGHVAVWVSDLQKYYSEASRILKTKGLFIVNEYHPFRCIWAEQPDRLERELGYFDRGPHKYDRSEEVPGADEGSFPSYEFNWTVSDYVTAMLNAGCNLLQLDEVGEETEDWEQAPLQGLPASLLIIGQKE